MNRPETIVFALPVFFGILSVVWFVVNLICGRRDNAEREAEAGEE